MTWVPSCSCDLREELTSSLGQAPLSYAQVNKQMTAHLRSLLLIKCLAAKGYKRRHWRSALTLCLTPQTWHCSHFFKVFTYLFIYLFIPSPPLFTYIHSLIVVSDYATRLSDFTFIIIITIMFLYPNLFDCSCFYKEWMNVFFSYINLFSLKIFQNFSKIFQKMMFWLWICYAPIYTNIYLMYVYLSMHMEKSWTFTTKMWTGTSLVVQWLRLRAPNVGGLGPIPGQETGSPTCCN